MCRERETERVCVLPADRYTQQTHQSRREKGRAAETRNLCACVSEERGRGSLPVLVLPADRYTLLQFKKNIPRHFVLFVFFIFYVKSALVNKKRVNI